MAEKKEVKTVWGKDELLSVLHGDGAAGYWGTLIGETLEGIRSRISGLEKEIKLSQQEAGCVNYVVEHPLPTIIPKKG